MPLTPSQRALEGVRAPGPDLPAQGSKVVKKRQPKVDVRKKRAKRPTDNASFDGMMRRCLAAYGRRVAAGDVTALGDLQALRQDLDQALEEGALGLRRVGYSWQAIADALGVTK